MKTTRMRSGSFCPAVLSWTDRVGVTRPPEGSREIERVGELDVVVLEHRDVASDRAATSGMRGRRPFRSRSFRKEGRYGSALVGQARLRRANLRFVPLIARSRSCA
jgi:hypothetical protein